MCGLSFPKCPRFDIHGYHDATSFTLFYVLHENFLRKGGFRFAKDFFGQIVVFVASKDT